LSNSPHEEYPVNPMPTGYPFPAPTIEQPLYPDKRKGVAIALWFVGDFGLFNIHNFYLGKVKMGLFRLAAIFAIVWLRETALLYFPLYERITYLLFLGLFFWSIVDLVLICARPKRDFGKSAKRAQSPGVR
jgi:hypothetical protein